MTDDDTMTPEPTDDFWASPDDVLWDRKAKQLRYDGLAPLQARAEKWGAAITGILGVFGTVAFVTGPDTFEKTDPTVAPWVLGLIVLAGVAATFAVALCAYAAHGVPKWFDELDGDAVKAATFASGRRVVENLLYARWLGLGAAVLLFASPGNARVGYDGPHPGTPGPHHDVQHISWQGPGKNAMSGNIPYSGPRHPSRARTSDRGE